MSEPDGLISAEEAEELTAGLGQIHAGGWRVTASLIRLGVPKALGLSNEDWVAQRLGGTVRLAVEERREAAKELEAEKMTQEEIAATLGVSQQTVSNDLAATKNSKVDTADQQESVPAVPELVNEDALAEELIAAEVIEEPVASEPIEPAEAGWHQLGRHWLWCGDSTDPEFVESCGGAVFAFADPPYNADKADWDTGFVWRHDFLAEVAERVAVTPGIASLPAFLNKTTMPYKWMMSAEIVNGMTRGALGFGNWIPIALFSSGSIYRAQAKDIYRIPAATSDDDGGSHPSRKPLRLLTHLIGMFSFKGDKIIDPFLGSGTTLLAAEREGRICVGAEVDPMYCAEIMARFRQST